MSQAGGGTTGKRWWEYPQPVFWGGYDSLVCYLQVFASYFARILVVCDASHPTGLSAVVVLPQFHEVAVFFHCWCLLEVRMERV